MRLRQPLFLAGFAGSGKTTIGRLLAKQLGVRFYDTDGLIETKTGKSVRQLFAEAGEKRFRDLESEVLAELTEKGRSPKVIALGGGALMKAGNRKAVASAGTVLYLRCNQRELYRRLRAVTDRPLLAAQKLSAGELRKKIRSLMRRRLPGYRAADHVVSTSQGTPAAVAARILTIIGTHDGQD